MIKRTVVVLQSISQARTEGNHLLLIKILSIKRTKEKRNKGMINN